jgi:hypothetical protein
MQPATVSIVPSGRKKRKVFRGARVLVAQLPAHRGILKYLANRKRRFSPDKSITRSGGRPEKAFAQIAKDDFKLQIK